MKIKEQISIDDLDDKKYQIRMVEPFSEDKAILSHYLQNIDNGASEKYRDRGERTLKNLIDYKTEEHIPLAKEEALQQLLFEVQNVPFPKPEKPIFSFIDLFAGVGGFRIALQNIMGKCVFTSEWEKDAKKTYSANFGDTPFGDITKEFTKDSIPEEFDILCAGFPCQAFSIAGLQKGFSDTRGTLFFDIEQIVEKHKPKVLFLENVKNLVSHDKGRTFKVICEILEEKLGYKVYAKVLNSMTHANVPQNRERIFIIAFHPQKVPRHTEFKFPDPVPLTKTIHDFLEKDKQEDKYYYSPSHQYFPQLNESMVKKDTVYQWRRVYVRENKSNVCPTLTANMGTGGHNVPLIKDRYGIRKLTPKECFAFQGYPVRQFILPAISNGKLYMQAGNSVTVPLIQRIAKNIIKVL